MTARTGHVGINVSDLDRSVGFYADVFGLEVLERSDGTRSDGEPRRFAFLGDGERLVVTLWEQARRPFDPTTSGLHHLSFEVSRVEDVLECERRLRDRGATIHHDGIVAHGEGASSGGIFFEDPDGARLEVYTPTGLQGHAAPDHEAPTCGFF